MLSFVVERSNWSNLLWALGGIALFLGCWTLAALEIENPVLLPDPAAVVDGFFSLLRDGTLMSDVGASMQRVLVLPSLR